MDLIVKSCVRFTIYSYRCLAVSNLNPLNIIHELPILFVILLLLVRSCPFADVFQLEMWSEFFSSTPEHLQPTVSLVTSTVLGCNVDGTEHTYLAGFRLDANVGLLPTTFASFLLIPFRSQFIYSAAFRMPILLLQFLMPFIALTGRSGWLSCLKSPIILWLP